MVVSILDNDLYKFSMGYAYMRLYPEAEGRFEFQDRNNTTFSGGMVDSIKKHLSALETLGLSDEEKTWAIRNIPYIPAVYWEWLSGFRYEPDKINVYLDDDSHLHIDVTDKLYKVTLYEVPILAIVSEVVNRINIVQKSDVLARLKEKVELSNVYELSFSEFGTRRRFSYQVQNWVVEYLKQNAVFCTGTSNVHFAMKYDMRPIGTVAHEWVMFHGANFGYRMGNYEAYEAWVRVFDGALGIALPDTFTVDAFLRNFSLKQAKLFDGVRHDSGDERDFIYKVVDRYKELGVDPMTKTIVFSNALNFPKFKDIAEFCNGKVGKCSAGIGTNLTNDTGFQPMNIVMKLSKCRMNANQDWLNCVKISDDKGKVMGNPNEVEIAMRELDLI